MKRIKEGIVLLLTSCVNPKGMGQTILQNADIRLNQYLEAIRYYLSNTIFPIIVVDNTNIDYSACFTQEMTKGRLECLFFEGNNFDRSLGKGYGEGEIINYAFNHSRFLREYNYIVKVSGRHRILNINTILSFSEFFLNSNPDLIISEFNPEKRFSRSDLFVASKSFFEKYMNKGVYKCNDANNIWFEHILYECTEEAYKEGFQCLYLPVALDQRGISGTGGTEIPATLLKQKIHFFLRMLKYKVGIRRL